MSIQQLLNKRKKILAKERPSKRPKIFDTASGSKAFKAGLEFETKTDFRILFNTLCEKTNHTDIIFTAKTPNATSPNATSQLCVKLLCQNQLKAYLQHEKIYQGFWRHPDESFIYRRNGSQRDTLHIVEKKEQRSNGSAIDKIFNAIMIKYEYESCVGHMFDVQMTVILCQNLFEKLHSNSLKFTLWRQTLNERGIVLLNGDAPDYITQICSHLGFVGNITSALSHAKYSKIGVKKSVSGLAEMPKAMKTPTLNDDILRAEEEAMHEMNNIQQLEQKLLEAKRKHADKLALIQQMTQQANTRHVSKRSLIGNDENNEPNVLMRH